MAFQTGTRINPRLGALDFSGFARAAEIQRQGVEQLGEKVGVAVEKYAKSKREKKDRENRELALEQIMPEGTDPGLIKTLANDEEAFPAALQYVEQKAHLERNQGALNEAIAYNTLAGGQGVDLANVPNTFLERGGTDMRYLNDAIKSFLPSGPKMTALEEKIQRRIELGQTREEAIKGALGTEKTIINPVTGNLERYDTVERTSSTIPTGIFPENGRAGGQEGESLLPEGQETIWEIVQDPKVTGLWTSVKGWADRFFGSIHPDIGFLADEVKEDRDKLEKFVFRLTRSFREGDRFTATEQKQLLKELDFRAGPTTPLSTIKARVRSTYDVMQSMINQNYAISEDPSLNKDQRAIARGKAKELEGMLDVLGNPYESQELKVVTTQEEYDKLPLGALYKEEDGKTYRKQ